MFEKKFNISEDKNNLGLEKLQTSVLNEENKKIEEIDGAESLKKETGIDDSILKKIRENTKLRKVFFSMLLSAGLLIKTESASAKDRIDFFGEKNENKKNENKEAGLQEVSAKELKKMLKDYDANGGMTIDFIVEQFKDCDFKISDPVLGQTFTAANLLAQEQIKNTGTTSNKTNNIFTFSKKVGKNVIVVKVVAYK